jgi:hypothetical protein
LINGAVAAAVALLAEAVGEVEDGLRLAKGQEFLIVAALGKETGWVVFCGRHGGAGVIQKIGLIGPI